MPTDPPARPRLEDRFVHLSRAIRSRQDRSGLLHNVLDDSTSAQEASATLLFVSGFARGVADGLLPTETYLDAALREMEARLGIVDGSGAVGRVALAPDGPGVPLGDGIHGQGLFLLAAARANRLPG